MIDEQANLQNEESTEEQSPEDSGQPAHQGTNGQQLPTWKYADSIPGSGDKPDWFMADKYGSVAEQAKAANELRRKLGSKAEDAPEHYDIDYEKYGIDKEDPIMAEFNPFFKELNVPQKDYEKIVDKFVSIQQSNHAKFLKEREEAFNAFGPDTRETVGRLKSWATNNFSKQENEMLDSFMDSAESIQLLEKMRSGSPKSAPPTAHQAQNLNQYDSLKSINDEIGQNWKKMSGDDSYRKVMLKKREEAHKREN